VSVFTKIILYYLLIDIVVVAAIAGLLVYALPDWSSKKVIAASAAPIPIVFVLYFIWLLVELSRCSNYECSASSGNLAGIGYLAGIVAAAALFRLNLIVAGTILWRRQ
jgi:hypothetical protein